MAKMSLPHGAAVLSLSEKAQTTLSIEKQANEVVWLLDLNAYWEIILKVFQARPTCSTPEGRPRTH